MKVSGVEYVQADLKSAAPFVGRFDHVLLDVPCSGLGTIRSNPDLRWLVTEEDLPRHHVRQVQLLRNGFDALKRRGLLIYATCSTEPEENESVVEEFLGGRSDARVDGPYLRTFPVAGETGDGFFAARVRRL